MKITSPEFAAFSLVVLLVYYLLPRRPQNLLLLAASYVFLASWDIGFAAVFAVLTVGNYFLGLGAVPGKPSQRWAVAGGILLNLGALAFFKYTDFFVPDGALGLKILLPIGLSFYILQAISTLLDIQRGLVQPSWNFVDFAVYMAYFPRVTSGPIERARDFIPKLENGRIVDNDTLARSFTLILVGMVRKLALADVLLVMLPKDIFEAPGNYAAPALGLWLLAYGFALYNDFAGYTSIIRGVSALFGIELSPNFSTPYFARNFTEFWQRWHISLSNWLRDYIFTPLTRAFLRRKFNSRHALTVVVPPIVTMLASGLWHEARWGMLLWGLMHGLFQVVERVRSILQPGKPPAEHPWWRQGVGMLIVSLLALLAWVPFRTDNFADYWASLFKVAQWINPPETFELLTTFHVLVMVLTGITLLMDVVQYRKGEFAALKWSPLAQAVLINAAVILIILGVTAQGEAPPPFIYQGF